MRRRRPARTRQVRFRGAAPAVRPATDVPRITGDEAKDQLRMLADEQTALRRVAELVAGGAPPEQLFDAVAVAAARLVEENTTLLRLDGERRYTIVATCGGPAPAGTRIDIPATDQGVVAEILRTRRPARLDDYGARPGTAYARDDYGVRSAVGVPIVVDGRIWGVLGATTEGRRLADTTEHRLAQFAGLVAAALANTQARTDLQRLADEQSALRAVAELVARGVAPATVFAAVAAEASALLDGTAMTLSCFDGDSDLVVMAAHGGPAAVGTRIAFLPGTLPDRVRRDGRPVRVDDYTAEADAALAAGFGLSGAVAVPIVVAGGVWGFLTATTGAGTLPAGIEDRLQQFTKLVAAALANVQARAEVRALADGQAALRRVAELAAREAPAEDVLAAVAREVVAGVPGVDRSKLLRYRPGGSAEVVALGGAPATGLGGRPAPDGEPEFPASVAVPIHTHGQSWGALVAFGRQALPPSAGEDLAHFAELAGVSIAAAQDRNRLRMLADEQAALRRVAVLIARGAVLGEVFAAVATEASKLLGGLASALLRYEDDDMAVVVAACDSPAPVGLRIPSLPDSGNGAVRRTGRPARTESYAGTSLAALATELDVASGVAVPVTVEGRVWGALTASSSGPPLPADVEDRLAEFTDLVAAAIAHAQNKAKLTASRTRVVATADETRRRLQRDLHDGAQQRLVHAIIALKLARDAAASGDPPGPLIEEALKNAQIANRELRDLVRGILPAALTRGGLRTGIESLADDLTLPVDVRVGAPRLPAEIETTAYFVVAEALTNVVKHADAGRARVDVDADADRLVIDVRDDGRGGADPARGTGLTGLLDRVEAGEGTLTIDSPAGIGTTVHVVLPLHRRAGE